MNRKQKALLVFVPAILILAILLVVALPSYFKARKQSQQLDALSFENVDVGWRSE